MTRYGSNFFYYTGEGYRYRKNNTYYSVWQGKMLAEWTGSNIIYYLYDIHGDIVGMCYNDTIYHYVKNVQGDVVALLDANGRLLGRYIYDPWGKIVKTVDANGNTVSASATSNILNINPIRYRSYYYDRETGFYYLQTRYYDPEVGRFINADSFQYIGDTGDFRAHNLYVYCGNNPVSGYDPQGTWDWERLGWKVALTGVCIVAAVVTTALTGGAMGVMWATIGVSAIVGAASAAITTGGDVEEIVHGALDGAIAGSFSAISQGLVKKWIPDTARWGDLGKKAIETIGSATGEYFTQVVDTGAFNITAGDIVRFGATRGISSFCGDIVDGYLDDNILSKAWSVFTRGLHAVLPETVNDFLELL